MSIHITVHAERATFRTRMSTDRVYHWLDIAEEAWHTPVGASVADTHVISDQVTLFFGTPAQARALRATLDALIKEWDAGTSSEGEASGTQDETQSPITEDTHSADNMAEYADTGQADEQ